jgi:tetratricopeptide (TPR) repeat protein
MSRALRGLGARRLAAQQFDEARALFERDLALHERAPGNAPQLAISLDSLALVLEQLGDLAGALALRTRQRATLATTAASASQLQMLDDRIAKLSGA